MLRRALNELFTYLTTGLVIFYLGHLSGAHEHFMPLLIGGALITVYSINSGLREFLSANLEARLNAMQDFMSDVLADAEILPEEDDEDI